MRQSRRAPFVLALVGMLSAAGAQAQPGTFDMAAGERVVLIGNTLAERMQIFPYFEAIATATEPERRLHFRYLAWSGDELNLRPRPLNFGDLHAHLEEQRADVILAAFGGNESFRGEVYLPQFRHALGAFVDSLAERSYNGSAPPRIILLSPIPHERLDRIAVDADARNVMISRYRAVMEEVAAERGVHFVDLFTPLLPLMDDPGPGDLTINGVHLNGDGNRIAARVISRSLGWLPRDAVLRDAGGDSDPALVEAIRLKNELFFLRWRAVNGEYIYGRRREPFGVQNFPEEMRQIEEMIAAEEEAIWQMAGAGAPSLARLPSGGLE